MIEAKIEALLAQKLSELSELQDVQLICSWGVATPGKIKGLEEGGYSGVLTLKVKPREYAMYTAKEASFEVSLTLNIRAEGDATGVEYLRKCEAVASAIQPFQSDYSAVKSALSIAEEFSPTGFRLDGGDCGYDDEDGVFTYQQNFTIQGIIK